MAYVSPKLRSALEVSRKVVSFTLSSRRISNWRLVELPRGFVESKRAPQGSLSVLLQNMSAAMSLPRVINLS